MIQSKVLRGILVVSLLAGLVVGVQAAIVLFQGEAVCLNQGCKIVEGLTAVPPLYFNILGLVYFQAVFWAAFVSRTRESAHQLLRLLLLTGLAAEGILLGYQAFVAHSFCSYCLFVFLAVLTMNALAGRKQLAVGLVVMATQMLFFSLLTFAPAGARSQGTNLDRGTFAVRTCSDPVKEMYLIFSEECPHCQKVLKALENCTRCEFHFNPIAPVSPTFLDDLKPKPSFDPSINITTLEILGINTIPLLIVKESFGLTLIKGDKEIIDYISRICFQEPGAAPGQWFDPFGTGQEDVCSPAVQCE